MHYGPGSFASNTNKPTIIPLQEGVEIGQRRGLSHGDIVSVLTLYPKSADAAIYCIEQYLDVAILADLIHSNSDAVSKLDEAIDIIRKLQTDIPNKMMIDAVKDSAILAAQKAATGWYDEQFYVERKLAKNQACGAFWCNSQGKKIINAVDGNGKMRDANGYIANGLVNGTEYQNGIQKFVPATIAPLPFLIYGWLIRRRRLAKLNNATNL